MESPQPQRKPWFVSQEQKTLFWGLCSMSILMVGLSAYFVQSNFKRPFVLKTNPNTPAAVTQIDDSLRDTDGDGLLDTDELTIYGTSPFLVDSDSDGISDKAEIDAGTDPNCPIGSDCGRGGATTGTVPTVTPAPITPPAPTDVSAQPPAQPSGLDKLTAPQIRALLLKQGVSQAQLDAISDTQLMQVYQQSLGEINTSNP